MKTFVISLAIAFIIALFTASGANANEGFWTNMRTAVGGYYSKDEHPDISLEKEVLIYCESDLWGSDCEAHFLFRNSSPNPVSVKVGFPVKLDIPLINTYEFDPIYSLVYFFVEENKYTSWEKAFDNANWERFENLSMEKFEELNRIAGDNKIIYTPNISQDGRTIDIESIMLESTKTKKDEAVVQFHFLHQLDFQPDSYSHVVVKYRSFNTVEDPGAPPESPEVYDWRYILGTGRTWNGQIQTVYFLAPENLKPDLPEQFKYAGGFKNNHIFLAWNYEPSKNDNVTIKTIRYNEDGWYRVLNIRKPETTAQNFVDLKAASSYLPQRTWINSPFSCVITRGDSPIKRLFLNHSFSLLFEGLDAMTPFFVIENHPVHCEYIGFDPLSLFDGLPTSAWCEGVKGDGINEWVEFDLSEDVQGISVYNGFIKSPQDVYSMMSDEDYETAVSKIEAIYTNNNRVKRIEFVSSDGAVKRAVELQDTRERQDFDDIDLPKGTYKVYIRDIYKGAKWDDTCLGEITFHSASAQGIVEQDAFLKKVLDEHFGSNQ